MPFGHIAQCMSRFECSGQIHPKIVHRPDQSATRTTGCCLYPPRHLHDMIVMMMIIIVSLPHCSGLVWGGSCLLPNHGRWPYLWQVGPIHTSRCEATRQYLLYPLPKSKLLVLLCLDHAVSVVVVVLAVVLVYLLSCTDNVQLCRQSFASKWLRCHRGSRSCHSPSGGLDKRR